MTDKPTLAITIIGHNEKDHLRELLPVLSWANAVIYVDCESQDGSADYARTQNCRVFERPNNPNLNINKSFAMEQATQDWIFYLDPDERISSELAQEIITTLSNSHEQVAFQLKRKNHYFGRWLRFGSQYPDIQLRLFKRGHGQFPQKHVHEKLEIDGKMGILDNDLLHYPYLTISQYIQKFNFYTSFEAQFLHENGKKPGFFMGIRYIFLKPLSRFIRRYFFKFGFRDGWQGFFAAIFDAMNYQVRYFKLIEISRQAKVTASNEI
ncbi:MAG: glycosyltransferase family 2 protein [bacterium]|nr:MAG: glycosyltransferase family 2 protein [bacterium]